MCRCSDCPILDCLNACVSSCVSLFISSKCVFMRDAEVIHWEHPLLCVCVWPSRWFHREITGQEAEEILRSRGSHGSFLARPSKKVAGNFSLSVRYQCPSEPNQTKSNQTSELPLFHTQQLIGHRFLSNCAVIAPSYPTTPVLYFFGVLTLSSHQVASHFSIFLQIKISDFCFQKSKLSSPENKKKNNPDILLIQIKTFCKGSWEKQPFSFLSQIVK